MMVMMMIVLQVPPPLEYSQPGPGYQVPVPQTNRRVPHLHREQAKLIAQDTPPPSGRPTIGSREVRKMVMSNQH